MRDMVWLIRRTFSDSRRWLRSYSFFGEARTDSRLKLWTRMLSSLPESDIYALKRSSRRWPAAIRARFDHAWSHHERDTLRWRTDSSCRPVQDLSTVTSPKIQDLSTAKLASEQKSKI